MTRSEVRRLLRSHRVMLRLEVPTTDEWTYQVRLDGVTVGEVTRRMAGWFFVTPLPDGGSTINGPWKKQRTAVRELLRTL